jgi:hypothetical protein
MGNCMDLSAVLEADCAADSTGSRAIAARRPAKRIDLLVAVTTTAWIFIAPSAWEERDCCGKRDLQARWLSRSARGSATAAPGGFSALQQLMLE